MNFSLLFPQQATQTSALQQRDPCSPYSTNNAHKDLGWGVVPWKHLDRMGLPLPQHTFGFPLSCCFCLERQITQEKLKSLFSLFQDC